LPCSTRNKEADWINDVYRKEEDFGRGTFVLEGEKSKRSAPGKKKKKQKKNSNAGCEEKSTKPSKGERWITKGKGFHAEGL